MFAVMALVDGGIGSGIQKIAIYGLSMFLTTVDTFLLKMKDILSTRWGLNSVVMFAAMCLGFAFFLHVYDLLYQLIKTQRVQPEPLKKMGMVFVWVVIAVMMGNLFSGMADRMKPGLDEAIKSAKASVLSVNVVMIWTNCLDQMRKNRREQFVSQFKSQNDSDALKAADAMLKQETGVNDSATGWWAEFSTMGSRFMDGMKAVGSNVIEAGNAALAVVEITKKIPELAGKVTVNIIAYIGLSILMFCAYVAFVIVFAWKMLLLLVYFKVALTVFGMFFPAVFLMGYFRSLRRWAYQCVRYAIVMLVTIGLMLPAIQSIFSLDNFKAVITHAMTKNPIGNTATLNGSSDLTMATFRVDAYAEKFFKFGDGIYNPFFWAEIEVTDMVWGMITVAETMFVISLMAMMVLKMYELVSGTLSGSWNPVLTPRDQSGARSSANEDILRDQQLRATLKG